MSIKILGEGCPNRAKRSENAKSAAEKLGPKYELIKLIDFVEIAVMGVMKSPALAVDGTVLHSGSVASAEECRGLFGIE